MGRPRIYDWDKWFSKSYFYILRDTFNVSYESMAQQIRNAANARGLYVSIIRDVTHRGKEWLKVVVHKKARINPKIQVRVVSVRSKDVVSRNRPRS